MLHFLRSGKANSVIYHGQEKYVHLALIIGRNWTLLHMALLGLHSRHLELSVRVRKRAQEGIF